MTVRGPWSILAHLIAPLIFLSLSFFLVSHQADDAYIFFRYATNIANGNGAVFNPGERVEGVSSLLWTAVLTVPALLNLDLEIWGTRIAQLCGVLVLLLLPGLARVLGRRDHFNGGDFLVPLLVATAPPFTYWSSTGMETALFTLLIVTMLKIYISEKETGGGYLSGLFGGLLLFTRPEVPLLFSAPAIDLLTNKSRKCKSMLIKAGGITLCFLLALITFRYLYFADLLPNTYYAKTGASLRHSLSNGVLYCAYFLKELFYLPVSRIQLLIPIVSMLLVVTIAIAWKKPRLRPLALLILLFSAIVTYIGGDWMILSRFWVPVLPLIYLLIVSIGEATARRIPGSAAGIFPFILLLAWLNIVSGWKMWQPLDGILHPLRSSYPSYMEVSSYILERAKPNDVIALMDIGQVGYQTGLSIIDISGLTDRAIAKQPGGFLDKRYPASLVLDRKPGFFVLRPDYEIDRRFLRDPEFTTKYTEVFRKACSPLTPDQEILVFQRNTNASSARAD